MTRIGTMLIVAAALAIGAVLGGGGLVQARLGTGAEAIGGAPGTASSEAPQSVAPAAVGTCVTNRTAFRTQTNQVTTTTPFTTFVTMPNTHLPVTHQAGCLIVDFAGLVTAGSDNEVVIRAWIPGIGAAEPFGGGIFLGLPVAENFLEARSMRFVFPNVPAGTHTVRIDWATLTGGAVYARERTLTVQYR